VNSKIDCKFAHIAVLVSNDNYGQWSCLNCHPNSGIAIVPSINQALPFTSYRYHYILTTFYLFYQKLY